MSRPLQTAASDITAPYYTVNSLAVSYHALWRQANPTGAPGGWRRFWGAAARKFVGRLEAAEYGLCRETELPDHPADQVPPALLSLWDAHHQALRDAGLEHVQYHRTPWIGGMTPYSSIWRDPAGAFFVNVSTVWNRQLPVAEHGIIFACHSWLESGELWHTLPGLADESELITRRDIDRSCHLAPETLPAYVLRRHQARIAGRGDVIRHGYVELARARLENLQTQFDHLVANRVYRPLTLAEVAHLRGLTQLD
jgi:hypothetical protein